MQPDPELDALIAEAKRDQEALVTQAAIRLDRNARREQTTIVIDSLRHWLRHDADCGADVSDRCDCGLTGMVMLLSADPEARA